MVNKSLVSIAKCHKIHDYGSVGGALKESLDLVGGLDSLISASDKVLVKSNLIAPHHGELANLRLILASFDTVAADSVAASASVMGSILSR